MAPHCPRISAGVWTSTDLHQWVEHPVDLSVFPIEALALPWAVVDEGTNLGLTFEVRHFRPGLEAITDLDELIQWVREAGWTESGAEELAEALPEWGIDFPLDDEERFELETTLDLRERIGVLSPTTGNGTDWQASYQPTDSHHGPDEPDGRDDEDDQDQHSEGPV